MDRGLQRSMFRVADTLLVELAGQPCRQSCDRANLLQRENEPHHQYENTFGAGTFRPLHFKHAICTP